VTLAVSGGYGVVPAGKSASSVIPLPKQSLTDSQFSMVDGNTVMSFTRPFSVPGGRVGFSCAIAATTAVDDVVVLLTTRHCR
jgi:hypothetical protein